MKKRLYETPTLERIEIQTEQGFAATTGTELWYDKKGEGNFDYIIDNDETWG